MYKTKVIYFLAEVTQNTVHYTKENWESANSGCSQNDVLFNIKIKNTIFEGKSISKLLNNQVCMYTLLYFLFALFSLLFGTVCCAKLFQTISVLPWSTWWGKLLNCSGNKTEFFFVIFACSSSHHWICTEYILGIWGFLHFFRLYFHIPTQFTRDHFNAKFNIIGA